jgi:hypothetical protein
MIKPGTGAVGREVALALARGAAPNGLKLHVHIGVDNAWVGFATGALNTIILPQFIFNLCVSINVRTLNCLQRQVLDYGSTGSTLEEELAFGWSRFAQY